MSVTYLLVNFFSVLVPFGFSFHPKLRFDRTWRAFFPAMLLVLIAFISWDIYFTKIGIWGFNDDYLTKENLIGLPIEEWLFFICIPYACVFTYHSISFIAPENVLGKIETSITILLLIFLSVFSILYFDRMYTFWTFSLLFATLFILKFILKVVWLSRFYIVYAVLLIPFLLVDGILTGTGLENPVVWYNDDENIGYRILTIPIEDVFYGMLLILLNIALYERLKKRFIPK